MPSALGFIPIFTSPPDVAIAITAPSAGTDVDPYFGTTVSGTCSTSATSVEVFLGATSLGSAVVTGATWSLTGAITDFALAGATQNLTAVANGSVTSAAVSVDVLTARQSFMLLSPLRAWFPPETVTVDYRVDSGNTEGGTRIDRWYSATDPGHTLAQDTDNDQPALTTVSGVPALAFDSADATSGDRMDFSSAFLSGLANIDLFIGFRRTAATAVETILDADAGEFRVRLDTDGSVRWFIGSTSNLGRTLAAGGGAGTDHLLMLRWNGAGAADADKMQIETDGVNRSLLFTGTLAQSAGHTTMCIGRTTSNGNVFGGSFNCVVAFDRTLSAGDKSKAYALFEQILPFTAP
jgi:hypothetical protein